MPNWRRAYVPGGTFFFTVVTDQRAELFRAEFARQALGTVVRDCRNRWPMTMLAWVLLPEHLHAIWSLPSGDTDYVRRWAWIKKEFTKSWLSAGGTEQQVSTGRSNDGRRGVWQPKYWEHTIESEHDFERHFDYIHYNPVKHGHVTCPGDWPWSTFHRWVNAGVYPKNWACGHREKPMIFDDIADTVGE